VLAAVTIAFNAAEQSPDDWTRFALSGRRSSEQAYRCLDELEPRPHRHAWWGRLMLIGVRACLTPPPRRARRRRPRPGWPSRWCVGAMLESNAMRRRAVDGPRRRQRPRHRRAPPDALSASAAGREPIWTQRR
jgi:hypothetical protein